MVVRVLMLVLLLSVGVQGQWGRTFTQPSAGNANLDAAQLPCCDPADPDLRGIPYYGCAPHESNPHKVECYNQKACVKRGDCSRDAYAWLDPPYCQYVTQHCQKCLDCVYTGKTSPGSVTGGSQDISNSHPAGSSSTCKLVAGNPSFHHFCQEKPFACSSATTGCCAQIFDGYGSAACTADCCNGSGSNLDQNGDDNFNFSPGYSRNYGSNTNYGAACTPKRGMKYWKEEELPEGFDWRTHDSSKLPPVTNQQLDYCPGASSGSCWLHASIAAFSSRVAIACQKSAVELSMEQVGECAETGQFQRVLGRRFHGVCEGEDPQVTFLVAKAFGLTPKTEFTGERCTPGDYKVKEKEEGGHVVAGVSEAQIPFVVKFGGPVVIMVSERDADGLYMLGKSADDPYCLQDSRAEGKHGYGTSTVGGDYWVIRNSYGTHWGHDGYGYIAKGRTNGLNEFKRGLHGQIVSADPVCPTQTSSGSNYDHHLAVGTETNARAQPRVNSQVQSNEGPSQAHVHTAIVVAGAASGLALLAVIAAVFVVSRKRKMHQAHAQAEPSLAGVRQAAVL